MDNNIQYRIFCNTENTEGGWVDEWAAEPITVCPNDALHDVNVNSVQEINSEHVISSNYTFKSTSNDEYTKLYCLYHDNINGYFRRVKLVCRSTLDTTSFDVKVFNYDTQTTLLETTVTNTTENTLINIGAIDESPADNFFLEIFAKRNNGTSGSVEVQQVFVYGIN